MKKKLSEKHYDIDILNEDIVRIKTILNELVTMRKEFQQFRVSS